MAFHIDEATEQHATATADCEYTDESRIPLPSGGSIRFPAHPENVDYVRVSDDEDRELMYWHVDEFLEEGQFADVMGAFLGLAKQAAEYK